MPRTIATCGMPCIVTSLTGIIGGLCIII